LITGKRAVVYVRAPGDKPKFEGREVVLGPKAGSFYVVLEGLSEGELVVHRGLFKIDSALQIQAKPSMMSLEGGESLLKPPAKHEIVLINHPSLKESTVDFIELYLEIQEKLTQDDYEGVPALASDLRGELQYFDYTELSAKELEVWNLTLDRLQASMEHLHHHGDIESFREAFKKVSLEVIAMIKLSGHAKPNLHHMYCSMAEGYWIQSSDQLLNPYYGANMLRCGDREGELSASPVAE
jgi:Cu(I)/Ag(I) efflux system membrane fusion protein